VAQLAVFVLIAALLGRIQCDDLCTFVAVAPAANEVHAHQGDKPCHQQQAPQDPLPSGHDKCSHQQIVIAEKPSKVLVSSSLESPWLAQVITVERTLPFLVLMPRSADDPFPPVSPLHRSSILRI